MGFLGKLFSEAKPATTGASAAGICGIARVGPVLLAVDREFVDLRVQGLAHQPRRAGKLDDRAARCHTTHLKALRREPIGHGLNVRIGGAELLPKLLRGEPLVIVGRGFDLLLIQQLPQRGFLLRRALQYEQHPFHGQAIGRGALVNIPGAPADGYSLAA